MINKILTATTIAILSIFMFSVVYAVPILHVHLGYEPRIYTVISCSNYTTLKSRVATLLDDKADTIKINNSSCLIEIPLPKKTKITYNLTPLLSIIGNKYKVYYDTDKFISISHSYPRNEEISNSKIMLIEYHIVYENILIPTLVLILTPLLSGFIYIWYIRRKSKECLDYINKAKFKSKMNTISVLYGFICGFIAIPLLFLLDYAKALSYIFNVSISVSFIAIILTPIIIYLLFCIVSAKYISQGLFNYKLKKQDYINIALLFSLTIIPILIIILMEVAGIFSSISNMLRGGPLFIQVIIYFSIGFCISYFISSLGRHILYNRISTEAPLWLRDLVSELCNKLGIRKFSSIRVINPIGGKTYNAAVTGIFRKELIITKPLIDLLSKEELKAILSHEIAHKYKKHLELSVLLYFIVGIVLFYLSIKLFSWFKIKNLPYIIIAPIMLFFVPYGLLILLHRKFLRKIEEQADEYAAKIADPLVYIRALVKIYIANYSPPAKESSITLSDLIATHPKPWKRLKKIAEKYNLSEEEINNIVKNAFDELIDKI